MVLCMCKCRVSSYLLMSGHNVLIHALGAAVLGFQWGGNVRVDPKGPEGVVEIKDKDAGEG